MSNFYLLLVFGSAMCITFDNKRNLLSLCSEENVYLLCKKLCTSGVADAGGSDLFVAFISNERKQACLYRIPLVNLLVYN